MKSLGVLSRADLVHALGELREEREATIAALLGFEVDPSYRPTSEPAPEESTAKVTPTRSADARTPSRESDDTPFAPVPHWRCVRADRHIDSPRDETDSGQKSAAEATVPLDDSELRSKALAPEPPLIVAEARLRRRLEAELRTPRPSRRLDVDRLVELWSRGDEVRSLPYEEGLAPARLGLVLDASPRLVPFRTDLLRLAAHWVARVGEERVRLFPGPSPHGDPVPPTVFRDEVILALSDLGFYGSARDRQPWQRYGRRLRKSGARLRALVPCPAWRWDRDLADLWGAIDWSHPEGAGQRTTPRPPTIGDGRDPAEILLLLLSPALRIEPGLVRHLRQALGEGFDLGTEADVWLHPEVDGTSSRTLILEGEARVEWARRQAEASFEERERRLAADAILEWHEGFSDVFQAIEILHLHATGSDDVLDEARVEAAIAVLERSAASLDDRSDPGAYAAITGFLRREISRAPERLVRGERTENAFVRIVRRLRADDPTTPLPAGVTADMLDPPDVGTTPRQWIVGWADERLVVRPESSDPVGEDLATFQAGRPRLKIDTGFGDAREIDLEAEPTSVEGLEGFDSLRLLTDLETIELERWTRPSWASAAGRDGYGLWAAFEIRGVEQRMRWIPPGRFWMGSPEDEAGRSDREGPRHEVVLTEGFWLGETPCTQALWEAVMEENPSHFPSPRRPVEQVSWENVQEFVDRLSFQVRDLEVQLPTEAEWEYACRAGTETATWVGDLALLGDNNAPILDSIAWYGGNSGVDFDLENGLDSSGWSEKQHEHSEAGTREVGMKAPNPWGLYDVLGNVYEWCWDWWTSYTAEKGVDPEGPEEGTERVIRGGSWYAHARLVRAAYRGAREPGSRFDVLGFRLSRGPGDKARGAQERGSAVPEAALRRSRRPARGRRSRAWVDRLGWAADGGLDCFGRWADLEVEGVRHRLRWIYPGRFWMGSPEHEAGRWDDEGPRHEVTLTEGFWLGETPCTQDLWQAVMGDNPSHFQSPRRPVEQVSWEDCQRFFERLREVGAFEGRLPTEAQWEYACRAGTDTATWVGDLEILGERNAPRLDSIAWYGGNSGVGFDLESGYDTSDWKEMQFSNPKAGTRIVGQKAPNPWGLYDMLGNVVEWCSDQADVDKRHHLTNYPEEPRVNPVLSKGTRRVIRGGSWLAHARLVRAAFRDAYVPGARYGGLGFRLSRGPQANGGRRP